MHVRNPDAQTHTLPLLWLTLCATAQQPTMCNAFGMPSPLKLLAPCCLGQKIDTSPSHLGKWDSTLCVHSRSMFSACNANVEFCTEAEVFVELSCHTYLLGESE